MTGWLSNHWIAVVIVAWIALSVLVSLAVGSMVRTADSREPVHPARQPVQLRPRVTASDCDRTGRQAASGQLTQPTSSNCAVATSKTKPRTSSRCGNQPHSRTAATDLAT